MIHGIIHVCTQSLIDTVSEYHTHIFTFTYSVIQCHIHVHNHTVPYSHTQCHTHHHTHTHTVSYSQLYSYSVIFTIIHIHTQCHIHHHTRTHTVPYSSSYSHCVIFTIIQISVPYTPYHTITIIPINTIHHTIYHTYHTPYIPYIPLHYTLHNTFSYSSPSHNSLQRTLQTRPSRYYPSQPPHPNKSSSYSQSSHPSTQPTHALCLVTVRHVPHQQDGRIHACPRGHRGRLLPIGVGRCCGPCQSRRRREPYRRGKGGGALRRRMGRVSEGKSEECDIK